MEQVQVIQATRAAAARASGGSAADAAGQDGFLALVGKFLEQDKPAAGPPEKTDWTGSAARNAAPVEDAPEAAPEPAKGISREAATIPDGLLSLLVFNQLPMTSTEAPPEGEFMIGEAEQGGDEQVPDSLPIPADDELAAGAVGSRKAPEVGELPAVPQRESQADAARQPQPAPVSVADDVTRQSQPAPILATDDAARQPQPAPILATDDAARQSQPAPAPATDDVAHQPQPAPVLAADDPAIDETASADPVVRHYASIPTGQKLPASEELSAGSAPADEEIARAIQIPKDVKETGSRNTESPKETESAAPVRSGRVDPDHAQDQNRERGTDRDAQQRGGQAEQRDEAAETQSARLQAAVNPVKPNDAAPVASFQTALQKTAGANAEAHKDAGITLAPVPGHAQAAEGSVETTPAAPARPHPMHPASEMVRVSLSKAASAKIEQMTIQLRPVELGVIEVKLDFSRAGRVRASVIAERQETLDLLQRDARSLERALQDSGLKTDPGGLEFNLKGNGGNSRQFASYIQPGNRRGPAFAGNEAEDLNFIATPTGRTAQGRVDIRI